MNAMNLVVNQIAESSEGYFAQAGAPGAELWQAAPAAAANSQTYTFPTATEATLSITVNVASAPIRAHGIRELASPLSD